MGSEPPQVVEQQEDDVEEHQPIEDVGDYAGAKTLDEISEEVPQDIKDKIIDLEAE